jgi:hypothetical protein
MEYNLENDDKNITRSGFSFPITMIFLQDLLGKEIERIKLQDVEP